MINLLFEIHGLEISNSEFVYINTVHPKVLLNGIDLIFNKGSHLVYTGIPISAFVYVNNIRLKGLYS